MVLRVRALGPLAAEVDGRQVALGGAKQRAVLAVLLAHVGRRVGMAGLTDAAWPDVPPRDPTRNLQVYVSALRSAMAPHGDCLQETSGGYRLSLPEDGFDVTGFERCVGRASDALRSGDHDACVREASAGLGLWRGEPYDDVGDVPALRPEIVRLSALRVELERVRIDAELHRGRHRAVLADLERLVAAHPGREDLLALLMLALHRSGRQQDALAAYASGYRWKADETGLEPGAPLRELQRAILADDPSLAVEDEALAGRRHLPAALTEFVGREADLAGLRALLTGTGRPPARWVTVTGPGGIGKTRLAVEAAHGLADEFPDGVWFVGLAELQDPDLVLPTIADALGLDRDDVPYEALLSGHLADRRALLLIDNLEHVLDAAGAIARVLVAAPGVTALVTSRNRADVYGEHEFEVDPLDDIDAVVLFEQRARSADRAFVLGPGDRGPVTEICRAVDRLPLGIELVAARLRDRALADVASGLLDSLDLAAEGPRDRSPRQQGLRGAIEWSCRLLAPEALAGFARLGTFVGGFTEEAASVVVGAGPDVLRELELAHLLRRAADGQRLDMLQTIRSYAVEVLAARGETEELADAHAAWMLSIAEEGATGLRSRERSAWMTRLAAEQDNARAALQRLWDRGDTEALLRVGSSLSFHWYLSGTLNEGIGWLERGLAQATDVEPRLQAKALHGLGVLLGERGESERALEVCGRSCELFRQVGDEAWMARSLNSQGGLARDLGRPELAEQLLVDAAGLRRRLDDPALPLQITLGNLSLTALDQGRLDAARDYAEECLALAGPGTADFHLAQTVLGDIAVAAGHLDDARALLVEGVRGLREHDAHFRLLECLETLAGLAASSAEPALALTLVAAHDRVLREDGVVMVPADRAMRERRLGRAGAGLDEAARSAALSAGDSLTVDEALDLGLARLCSPAG